MVSSVWESHNIPLGKLQCRVLTGNSYSYCLKKAPLIVLAVFIVWNRHLLNISNSSIVRWHEVDKDSQSYFTYVINAEDDLSMNGHFGRTTELITVLNACPLLFETGALR